MDERSRHDGFNVSGKDTDFRVESQKEDEYKLWKPLEMKWNLCPFGSEFVMFSLPTRPCWWFRIWLRAFLGWKFKPIEKLEDKNGVR